MAESASDYHRGEMDVHAQQDTFTGFVKMTKWGSLAIATSVLFFVVLFCTPAGFIAAAISAIVLGGLGIVFLREKSGPAHH